jgi:FAD-dependent urate hydroxylase
MISTQPSKHQAEVAMPTHTELLIIGAGPFGLATAAYAKHLDIDHVVIGKPMDFWQSNMPKGMHLRSACDWHLDPIDVHTIERYLQTKNLHPADVEPLSLDFYLSYAQWFQEQKAIEAIPSMVRRLDCSNGANHVFHAMLDDGDTITAKSVVIAVGFRYFKEVPEEFTRLLPAGRLSHTCDCVDFAPLKGKQVLVIGGRQSAFEWAALMHEQGAAAVHISHRHPTPEFKVSDWSWVNPLVEAMVANPGWFRNLSPEEKDAVNRRLWAEGRLKIEPWLEPRIDHKDSIKLWPQTQVVACRELSNGALEVRLDSGATLTVDHIILATGYKVNINHIPFLGAGNILPQLETRNGFPVLGEQFQTNLPGLFFTSFPAGQDFGPFFGFTVAVRASAKLIGSAVRH